MHFATPIVQVISSFIQTTVSGSSRDTILGLCPIFSSGKAVLQYHVLDFIVLSGSGNGIEVTERECRRI